MDYGWIGEAFIREAAVEGQGIGLFDWEGGRVRSGDWRRSRGGE